MTSSEDRSSTSTDDEITIDPEATNAADANWLAELRAAARAGGQSVAELLTDDAVDADQPDAAPATSGLDSVQPSWLDDADDEVTIDHRGQRDEIRRGVVESRPHDASESPPLDARSLEPPSSAAPSPAAPSPASRETLAQAIESVPPPPIPAGPVDSSPETSDGPSAPGPAPRWEAPPRLNTGRQAAPPALLSAASTGRRFDWRIVAAIAVAVVLGFVIALLISGGSGDDPVEDPSVSTVDAPVETGPNTDLDADEGQP